MTDRSCHIFLLFMFITWSLNLLAQDDHRPIGSVLETVEFSVDGQTADGVNFIFQDSRGFIWGSSERFTPMRFDGNSFDIFQTNPTDSSTISDGRIWASTRSKFFEDSAGKVWIIYTTGENLDCYNPQTEKFQRFRPRLRKAAGNRATGPVLDIFEDSSHEVWIGCTVGLFKFSPQKNTLQFFDLDGAVTLIFEDWEKNIWVNNYHSSRGQRLGMLNTTLGEIGDWVDYPGIIKSPIIQEVRQNDYYFNCEQDSSSLLVINGQLFEFQSDQRVVSFLKVWDEKERITSFWGAGEIVLMTTHSAKLFQYDPIAKTLIKLMDWSGENGGNDEILPANLFRSREGITWVYLEIASDDPTVGRKNIKFFPAKIPFHRLVRLPSIPKRVNGGDYLFELDGQVYLFTQPKLKAVRPDVKTIPQLDSVLYGIPGQWEMKYLFETDGGGILWMLAFGKGQAFIRKFDKKGKQVFSHRSLVNEDSKENYPGGNPQEMKIDQNGNLWIATRGKGLICFDPSTQLFQRYGEEVLSSNSANAICVDRSNNIWCGANDRLCFLDQQAGLWKFYPTDSTQLSGAIRTIYQDSRRDIWVATMNGLFKLGSDQSDFKYYGPSKGLIIGTKAHIFEDHLDQLWVNEGGNYLYDRTRDVFFPFGFKEGVLSPKTGSIGGLKMDEEGYIYLASGYDDIFYFKPEKMNLEPALPEVHFTGLHLFNEKVKPGDSTGILPKGIDFVKELKFTFAQNDLAIHFTAPEYTHPDKLEFLVKLEGFHEEWQNMGNKREVRFTGLQPGQYTLLVKVRNQFLFESETPRTLKITVLPPWYRTWWAYTLWAALILGSTYWFYRFQLRRQLAEAEAVRLKEMDAAKTRLYTNITHEFRTPLTIILGMADQMKTDPKNWFNEGLQLIRRNGKQLLTLVNQLLDLSKLESGHLPLNLFQGDVIAFLRYLVESFHSYADSRDIRLHFLTELKELQMDHDPEKLQSVVSNLLSNAIKFTPEGGDIYLQIGMRDEGRGMKSSTDSSLIPPPSSLLLIVRDNGPGIPPEHLPHIFDRFYQVDSTATRKGDIPIVIGTGIGLALTKELVKLMGGEISVESEIDKGTKFTVLLPVTQAAQKAHRENEEMPLPAVAQTILLENPQTQSPPDVPHSDQPLVLLIEDNADVITYLTSFLSGEYQIATANNGQEGIEKAIALIPDLVVSDVMMPEKDGFEVCATLKTDERTSHIPVILLTAKSGQPAKLEGLALGADAYLAKPFDKQELLVRMEKLIELRRRLQQRFQTAAALMEVAQKTAPDADELFLQKMAAIVEENLSDENFGLPELCRKATMSRSQLFRKLKALTGKSTTHFIRSIRLAKARELLLTTNLSVSEVCYETGFSNPAYFSRVFVEEFGVPPSEVRNR